MRKAAARTGEILRIMTRPEWETAQANGSYRGDTLATEGFIHCSTPKQLPWVAETFYNGRTGLVVLRIVKCLAPCSCYAEGNDVEPLRQAIARLVRIAAEFEKVGEVVAD